MTETEFVIVPAEPAIREDEARLNITYNGSNGDMVSPVPFDATDTEIKSWASEAIASGSVLGIPASTADFTDFVVDRFRSGDGRPWNLLVVRPKTPFGATFSGDVEVLVRMNYCVVASGLKDKNVTPDQMLEILQNQKYDDILDSEELEIIEVLSIGESSDDEFSEDG